MDEKLIKTDEEMNTTNIINVSEPIVNEIRKLLTKQDAVGYLTPVEKRKYLHYINMLGEVYKDKNRWFYLRQSTIKHTLKLNYNYIIVIMFM